MYKKGNGMSMVESGTVQCNNYSVTINNVQFTDLVKAGYYRASGDSGGIVFTAPSSGYASPAGIHMGGLTTHPSTTDSLQKCITHLLRCKAVRYRIRFIEIMVCRRIVFIWREVVGDSGDFPLQGKP